MYGKLGVLETDGERVQCHVCGKWYRSLGCHAWQKHGLHPSEYKKEFGLNRFQSLASASCQELLRDLNGERLQQYPEAIIQKESIAIRNKIKSPSKYTRRLQQRLKLRKNFVQTKLYEDTIKSFADGTHVLQSQTAKEKQRAACRKDEFREKSRIRAKRIPSEKRSLWARERAKNGTHPFQQPGVRAKALAARKRK